MIWILILLPALAGFVAMIIRSDSVRRQLLVTVAALHSIVTALCWWHRPRNLANGWLGMDAISLWFLSITSMLFLATSVYALGFLAREQRGKRLDFEEDFLFANASETAFTGCLLLFLSTMTLVTVSRHVGLLWVAVEATTLASAPLIMFHRHYRSLEATWKYLLICSVGIALALLGNFFLAAGLPSSEHIPMTLDSIVAAAGGINHVWLKMALVLSIIGYGTKMGLAPLHTWLPDAHSESPSLVSALLSGALLNCAFIAIFRMHTICVAANLGDFSRQLLLLFGLVSMGFAAIFIIAQSDFKRMLAYSSVEHMGILAAGIGFGGIGGNGAILHSMNHSLSKGMLFLLAGNILTAYKTKNIESVSGVIRRLPVSGVLWIAGFLAITGSPPFGTFISELTILRAAFQQGHTLAGVVYLIALVMIFAAMASLFLRMAYGQSSVKMDVPQYKEPLTAIAPPLILCIGVLALGVWIPDRVTSVIQEAVALLEAR
ncbi:MAG: proton-conducting transporter membrane subunit [Pseudomonadota bacterium]